MTSYADTVSTRANHLTEAEQKALLKVTGSHVAGYRDHVLFSLAMATGLREHEILALNVGDVMQGGKARRRVVLRVFKRSAKTEAPTQEVLLGDLVREKLERLIKNNRTAGLPVGDDDPIFVSREGNRLSERQARRVFGEWQERAGFERRLRFHDLRHTACTNLYTATKDIRLTQRFARHKSIATTSRYTHPSDDEMLRAVSALRC